MEPTLVRKIDSRGGWLGLAFLFLGHQFPCHSGAWSKQRQCRFSNISSFCCGRHLKNNCSDDGNELNHMVGSNAVIITTLHMMTHAFSDRPKVYVSVCLLLGLGIPDCVCFCNVCVCFYLFADVFVCLYEIRSTISQRFLHSHIPPPRSS